MYMVANFTVMEPADWNSRFSAECFERMYSFLPSIPLSHPFFNAFSTAFFSRLSASFPSQKASNLSCPSELGTLSALASLGACPPYVNKYLAIFAVLLSTPHSAMLFSCTLPSNRVAAYAPLSYG